VTVDVHQAAREFGQELQDLLDNVLPRRSNVPESDRQVRVIVGENNRYVVRLASHNGQVMLQRNDLPVAGLRIEFRCTHDSAENYLAVQRSTFELLSASDRTPLLRLDYDRAAHTVPTAHWNVHAERGAISHLLATTNPDHAGVLSKLHLPVGGSRMRPCLEDFIEMVVREFRVDTRSGAVARLEAGRETWRVKQTAVVARDAPTEVARVLRDLGYEVIEPTAGPAPTNTTALRRR
jgi:hypothetical protein